MINMGGNGQKVHKRTFLDTIAIASFCEVSFFRLILSEHSETPKLEFE